MGFLVSVNGVLLHSRTPMQSFSTVGRGLRFYLSLDVRPSDVLYAVHLEF